MNGSSIWKMPFNTYKTKLSNNKAGLRCQKQKQKCRKKIDVLIGSFPNVYTGKKQMSQFIQI